MKALETPPEERTREYERRWQRGGLSFLGAFKDLMVERGGQRHGRRVRARQDPRRRWTIPKLAELLSPKNTIGCKRLCIDIGYYETFNRPNVELIDVSDEPIEEITRQGVRAKGQEYEVDAIVFATGFDAMTGALLKIDIRGRGGLALQEKWREGPRTYLGVAMAGFPEPVHDHRPGQSLGAHQHAADHRAARGLDRRHPGTHARAPARPDRAEPPQAEEEWVGHVGELAGRTLRYTCSSWYLGVNIPGKPRVFMPYIGGFPRYVERCNEIAANGYEGFVLS